jgi:hypothetical protein
MSSYQVKNLEVKPRSSIATYFVSQATESIYVAERGGGRKVSLPLPLTL